MHISFTGKYAVDSKSFGLNFEAIVDGEPVVSRITLDALQDIDPSNAQSSPVEQFLGHQLIFESIAERKIRASKTNPVIITSVDVQAE